MMRLKRRKRKNKINKLIVLFILIILCVYFVINIFDKRVRPILLSYAEAESRKLTTLVINKAVTKQIALNMEPDNLYQIETNSSNEINIVSYNSVVVTKILNSITNLVQLNLKAIEEGNVDLLELPDNYNTDKLKQGIIYEVPFGAITNIAFLSNVGPKIPVKLSLIGDVTSGIRSNLTEYGINNALLEIGVNIEVTCRINMPFISEQIKVENTVPIVVKLIQGKVPEYYFNGFNSSDNGV